MKKFLFVLGLMMLSTVFSGSRQANALLLSVSGGLSTLGATPQIITAPTDINDDAAINLGMQGFNERQGVLLASDLAVDGGAISAGTTVSSHMIYLDEGRDVPPPGYNEHANVLWTFDTAILGVMSDYTGAMEAASSAFLGAAGTAYPGTFNGRGLEPLHEPDTNYYSVNGNELTVTMWVTTPGDWIRVVTAPEPSTLLLLGSGLIGLGFMTRRPRA